jgi:ABC-2 type transport system ATP-binding protein
LVDVQSLRVHFGAFAAVDGVSLTLRAGDLLGLIGPNGAGKTTLLRAMAGLQPTAAGQVRVLGEILQPGAPVMARVGFMPDTPALYEEMDVRTFLRFVAKGYGLSASDIDATISYWLERVWLVEKATQKIKSLSRGMRQRLGLARTLLPNPSVVLLDEPAAGLDPAGRVQFRKLLCELREQAKALVVSSHILADMADYCTHIAIMERGSLKRCGTVAEITAAANDMNHDRRR